MSGETQDVGLSDQERRELWAHGPSMALAEWVTARVAAERERANTAAVKSLEVEWSSRDTFGRIGHPYPPGQGNPYAAQSLLQVGGKPVYRVRTTYQDDVTEWRDFTGDEDDNAFYGGVADLALTNATQVDACGCVGGPHGGFTCEACS